MGKVRVHIDEQETGFIVQFQSNEPGRAGKTHACSELGQALDLILEAHDREQPTGSGVCITSDTTHDIGGR
tara:strand:- start:30569 stop:30781 length:213 start_codon:yes stop_codon:yes gene_type:complete